jgi:hypothetical protein
LVLGPYAGPAEAAQRVFERYRALGQPFMDLSDTMPWIDVQKIFDEDYPRGMRYYWKSAYLRDLDDGAIRALLASAGARPSALSTIDVWMLGGALSRKTEAESPLSHREAAFLIGIEANWEEPGDDAANVAWARDLAKALEPSSTGGSYLNFEDVRDRSVFATSHGESHGRLQRIKDQYDPSNLFG